MEWITTAAMATKLIRSNARIRSKAVGPIIIRYRHSKKEALRIA
jgi:hypothetical protein